MTVRNPIKLRKSYHPFNCDYFEASVVHCLNVCGLDYRRCSIRKLMKEFEEHLFKQLEGEKSNETNKKTS